MTASRSSSEPLTASFSELRRFARRRRPAESCEMCSLELGGEHQHLIEPDQRRLICVCDACALLFTAQEGTKLRRVPRQVRSLPEFRMSDNHWNALMIPIDLAFFFRSSPQDRVVAFYPSPAGATESLLPLDAWNEISNSNPILAEMTPDVEALLVNRVGAAQDIPTQYFFVPIDECYRLVGVIRMHWHGLSGGTEVWREIAKFFSVLKQKALVAPEATHA